MILGRLRILYLKIGEDFVPIGCLTSNSLEESVEELGTTTRDNAGWRTFRPTNQQYSIPFAGLQVVSTGDPGRISYDRLKLLKRNRERVEWKLEDTANGLIDVGYGYIVSLNETADVSDFLTFEGVLRGYGLPVELSGTTAPTAPMLNLIEPQTFTGYVDLSYFGARDDVGVTGYELRIRSTDGSERITTLGSERGFVRYFGVAPGFAYEFNIRAFDIDGNRSPWSNMRRYNLITLETTDSIAVFQDGVGISYNDETALAFNEEIPVIP